jgi:hypothetical protein
MRRASASRLRGKGHNSEREHQGSSDVRRKTDGHSPLSAPLGADFFMQPGFSSPIRIAGSAT